MFHNSPGLMRPVTFTAGPSVVSTTTDCQQQPFCVYCEGLTLHVRHRAVVIFFSSPPSLNKLSLMPLERREQPRVAPRSSASHPETFSTSEWNDAASTLQLPLFTSFSAAFGSCHNRARSAALPLLPPHSALVGHLVLGAAGRDLDWSVKSDLPF